ncbi:hypothetical protein BP6252_07075 [Coleophoma cylindrospora]|uniref:Uncharacterized protein n=1 Tax=Coleophoma cylindrospora TaxID=1849047 RepID=A0A3D8RGW3_9HELO|nr:hypothetical protein BP6252_07075 [Coleophoma cylindrospora]
MLNKTGWRIKHLISRSNRSLDNADDRPQNLHNRQCPSNSKALQRQSWSIQPSQELDIAVRRTTSDAARSRPKQAADYTMHSSASSLCSCEGGVHVDCEADLFGNTHSLSAAGSGRPNPAILYLPLFKSSTSLGSDAKTWKLSFPETLPAVPLFSSQRYIFESQKAAAIDIPATETFDLLEALALPPSDNDLTPTLTTTPTLRNKSMADSNVDVAENVERLIRETNAAFRAVGTALEDAKAATSGWIGTDQAPDSNLKLTLLGESSRRHSHKSISSPGSPLSRSSSVSKASRKRVPSKKTNARKRSVRRTSATPQNSRWTLTEMADVLSTKIFKTEVDEMLTPDRLQKLRFRAGSENKVSFDSDGSSGSDMSSSFQSGPFYLEEAALSVNAGETIPSIPSPRTPPPPVPEIPPENRLREMELSKADHQPFAPQEIGMVFNDVNFPLPPQHLPATRRSSYLKTIPETSSVVSFTPPRMSPIPAVESGMWAQNPDYTILPSMRFTMGEPILDDGSGMWAQNPDYIILPSTVFTMVSPLFLHGPVRIRRPSSPRRKDSVPSDDNLDWTAFQMALSGGISESFEDIEDLGIEGEEITVSEIMDWWADFGFESPGGMVNEDEDNRKKRGFDNEWYEQTFIRDRESQDPRDLYTRSIFRGQRTALNERRRAVRGPSPNRASDPVNEPRPRLQRIDSKHTEHSFKFDERPTELANETTSLSQGSPTTPTGPLPTTPRRVLCPTPPQNFAMPAAPRRAEDVSMRFNLAHDLGDYLRWDNQSRQSIFIDHSQI